MGFERKKIGLGKLMISTDNPRFKETKDQNEAIAIMLAKRGDEIYNMARDMLEVGQNPTVDISVYASPDGIYKVKDGNRRFTAIKLMMHPSLVPKADKVNKKRYKELNGKIDRSKYRYIDCTVFDDENEADLWVERNHSGFQNGIGQVQWDAIQKKRFASKRSNTVDPAVQVYDYVTAQRGIEARDKFPITTLERLLRSTVFRDAMGYRIEDTGVIVERDTEQFLDEMAQVIEDISGDDYTVRNFMTTDDISTYISDRREAGRFRPYEISEAFHISEAEKPPEPVPVKAPSEAVPCRMPTSKRQTLIPKDVDMDIRPEKINDIYDELKKLNVNSLRNCGSVMLRVFLDLSINYYLEEYEDHVVNKRKLSEVRTNTDFTLDARMNRVLDDLKNLKKIDDSIYKTIHAIMRDENLQLVVELNQYVHNYHFNPKTDDLKVLWNNLEGFFRAIFS